ncbi:MAG TPA: hypothetical protein VGD69_23155 [Herpetosiphonaceae bacterium]
MGHAICAALIKGPFDQRIAERYDLFGIALTREITMFHIDHYYSACWQNSSMLRAIWKAPWNARSFPMKLSFTP